MRFIILFVLLSPMFGQDGTYDKIIKDHDSAVKEIFDQQIVDQNKELERILAKEDYRTLTNQALITALGFGLTWAQDSPAPWWIRTMIIPVLKKRKINNSNDPIEVKNERKKRLRRNAQLGSIPFYKWIVIILRSPKAILDNISL